MILMRDEDAIEGGSIDSRMAFISSNGLFGRFAYMRRSNALTTEMFHSRPLKTFTAVHACGGWLPMSPRGREPSLMISRFG